MTEGPGLWAVALRATLDTFEELGLDVDALCRRIDLDRASLQDPDLRIPLAVAGRIWPVGVELWGRGGLGLAAGMALPFGRFEALDYAFATAGTVSAGLRCIEAYYRVVTGGITGIRVHVGDELVRVEHLGLVHPELRDYALGAFVQRIGRAEVRARQILLAGPPRVPPHEYEANFGCPVTFEAPATVTELSVEATLAELPPHFPGLRALVAARPPTSRGS